MGCEVFEAVVNNRVDKIVIRVGERDLRPMLLPPQRVPAPAAWYFADDYAVDCVMLVRRASPI